MSSRRSQSRSPVRRRSRSRGRRRSRSTDQYDKFGRSRDIRKTKTFKPSDLTNMSSRTADKLLNKSLNSDYKGRSESESVQPETEEPPVSRSIQSAILKNIIGDWADHDDGEKEDSVDDVVSKIISGDLDNDQDDFRSRMMTLKSQVTSKAKAGVYGKVHLDQEAASTSRDVDHLESTSKDEQNNDKELEEEAARLRKQLLEMKQKIKNKENRAPSPSSPASRTPSSSSSSASESESEVEEEEEEEVESESGDDSDEESNESETDHSDHSDTSDDGEEERPSVFDIFQTTVLQKEKSRESTHVYDDSMRKSRLVQTKTSKILKERLAMLKRKNKSD